MSVRAVLVSRQAPLEPERLDGVEARSHPGRVEAEDDAHCAGTADGHYERIGADQGGPRGHGGDAVRTQQPEPYPSPTATQRHGDGLHQELGADVALACADCQADADLPCTLRHRHQHDVHDPDTAYHQRDRGDARQEQRHGALRGDAGLGDLGGVPQVEIIFLPSPYVVPLPQQRDNLTLGERDGVRRDRRAEDVVQPRDPFELFLDHRVGHEDDVILVLTNRRLSFDRHHAEDLAGELLDADGLADRIGRAKQIGHHRLAEHTHLADGHHVVVREEGPTVHTPAPDRHEGRGDPAHLGGPVLVTDDDLDTQINVGGEPRQQGNLLLNRVHIPQRQALGPVRACPYPTHIAVASFDPDEVLAQAADLLLDLPRCPLPHGDTTDKSPDADTDPQHTEDAAERVACQGAQGDADDKGEGHGVSLHREGCIVHQVHTGVSRRLRAIVPRPRPAHQTGTASEAALTARLDALSVGARASIRDVYAGHERAVAAGIQGFTSAGHAQRFLSAHGPIAQHFRPRQHLLSASEYHQEMRHRFASWAASAGTERGAYRGRDGAGVVYPYVL